MDRCEPSTTNVRVIEDEDLTNQQIVQLRQKADEQVKILTWDQLRAMMALPQAM